MQLPHPPLKFPPWQSASVPQVWLQPGWQILAVGLAFVGAQTLQEWLQSDVTSHGDPHLKPSTQVAPFWQYVHNVSVQSPLFAHGSPHEATRVTDTAKIQKRTLNIIFGCVKRFVVSNVAYSQKLNDLDNIIFHSP